MCASTRYAPTEPDSGRVLGHTGGPLHVVVKFIRSKATGHTTSTDPSRSHYITSVGGRLMPTHRRRKPQARRCRAAVVVPWLPPFQTPIASLSPFVQFRLSTCLCSCSLLLISWAKGTVGKQKGGVLRSTAALGSALSSDLLSLSFSTPACVLTKLASSLGAREGRDKPRQATRQVLKARAA